MTNKNEALVKAQEIFQMLPKEKQKKIKDSEPEVIKILFGNEEILDNTVLENFIKIYEPELNITEKVIMVFSRLTLAQQIKIKNNDPKMYNALFDQKKQDNSILLEFLDKYEPLNEKIKSFEQFNLLSLEDQLKFKQSFPAEYAKILSKEPEQK